MQTDQELLERLKKCISVFERETGVVPSLEALSIKLGIRLSKLRAVIAQNLLSEASDGTSSFQHSLRDILLAPPKDAVHRGKSLVQVEDENGAKLGSMLWQDAQKLAEDKNLFLSLKNIKTEPPTAVIIEYGKFKYESEKRSRVLKQGRHVCKTKEVRIKQTIAPSDYKVKLQRIMEALSGGDKIKVVVVLERRDKQRIESAHTLIERILADLAEIALVERDIEINRETLELTLAPC